MFLIRADGNAFTGAGHLMRCLSVARELRKQSGGREEIHFVCADRESAALAQEQGFPGHSLGTDYRNLEAELPRWPELVDGLRQAGICRQEEAAALLVDSYYATDAYLEGLGQYGYVILMEDFGTHPYPVDCVVNYNGPASPEEYRKLYEGRPVELLIGCGYVPLREQFAAARSALAGGWGDEGVSRDVPAGGWVDEGAARDVPAGGWSSGGASWDVPAGRRRDGEVRNVLITAGGGDSENIAGQILERIDRPDLDFHLVIGRFSPHFEKMKALERENPNIHVRYNVENMAELMMGCDIAVTAGGSTIYELAALGVPFLCFSYADNQEALVDYVGARGIALSAGPWHRDSGGTLERIGRQFQLLAADGRKREECSRRGMALTDGRGAERLAEALFSGRKKHGELVYGKFF